LAYVAFIHCFILYCAILLKLNDDDDDTDGAVWSVCLSVSRSATISNPAKTAEPIEMPFGAWTRVAPSNHVGLLDGGSDLPCDGAILMRENVICMANGWLKEQDQLFFYNGIRALEKRRTKWISVAAGNYVEK